MFASLVAISPLFLGVGVMLVANGALNTHIPLVMTRGEHPEWLSGVVISAYYIGAVFGPFFIYRAVESIGHIRAFAAFVAIASITVLVYPFVESPWGWIGLRFINGICTLCILTCTESWINARTHNTVRGQVLAIYVIVSFLSLGIGQFVLGIPDQTGIAIFALVSVLFSVSALPVLATRTPQPTLPKPATFNLAKLYIVSPLGVLGTLIFGLIFGGFFGFGAVYASASGLDEGQTIRFMASAYFGGLLLQWPVGLLSDRIGRRPVLLCLAVGIFLIALAALLIDHHLFPILSILPFVFGAVTFSTYPICIAYINDYIAAEDLVKASGSLLAISYLGNGLGSLAASAFIDLLGHHGLFVFILLASAAIATITLWRIKRRPIIPTTDETGYQTTLRTSVVVATLDPRSTAADEP